MLTLRSCMGRLLLSTIMEGLLIKKYNITIIKNQPSQIYC